MPTVFLATLQDGTQYHFTRRDICKHFQTLMEKDGKSVAVAEIQVHTTATTAYNMATRLARERVNAILQTLGEEDLKFLRERSDLVVDAFTSGDV